jgi:hypothetical protein
MTTQQLKNNFLVLYDKLTNLAAPGYTDSEISLFLNKAQEQLIKRYYNYKGNKYKEGFEGTEKRRKDLSELITNTNITAVSLDQNGVSLNGILYDLPSNLLYSLREEITVDSSDPCYNGKRILVKPITHDEYSINKNNPFKKPDNSIAWRLDYGGDDSGLINRRHELITSDDLNVNTYHLRYIKRPQNIDITNGVTSELDESVHQEIIDIAVRIATGVTDPASYQIKMNEENFTE